MVSRASDSAERRKTIVTPTEKPLLAATVDSERAVFLFGRNRAQRLSLTPAPHPAHGMTRHGGRAWLIVWRSGAIPSLFR